MVSAANFACCTCLWRVCTRKESFCASMQGPRYMSCHDGSSAVIASAELRKTTRVFLCQNHRRTCVPRRQILTGAVAACSATSQHDLRRRLCVFRVAIHGCPCVVVNNETPHAAPAAIHPSMPFVDAHLTSLVTTYEPGPPNQLLSLCQQCLLPCLPCSGSTAIA